VYVLKELNNKKKRKETKKFKLNWKRKKNEKTFSALVNIRWQQEQLQSGFKDFSQLICQVVCVCASSSSLDSYVCVCVMTSLLPMGVGRHARNKSPVGWLVGGRRFSRSVLITMSTLQPSPCAATTFYYPHPNPPTPDKERKGLHGHTTGRVRATTDSLK
jgi:hypothetical protein